MLLSILDLETTIFTESWMDSAQIVNKTCSAKEGEHMIAMRPLTGGVAGIPLTPKPVGPTSTGLARAVTLERDRGRKKRDGNDAPDGEQRQQERAPEQKREFPVYSPHAAMPDDGQPSLPLDIIA